MPKQYRPPLLLLAPAEHAGKTHTHCSQSMELPSWYQEMLCGPLGLGESAAALPVVNLVSYSNDRCGCVDGMGVTNQFLIRVKACSAGGNRFGYFESD